MTVDLSDRYSYHIIPCLVLVVDDGSPETPSRVDTGSSDWDSGQVDQEHSEPDGKRSQDLPKNLIRLLDDKHYNKGLILSESHRQLIEIKFHSTSIALNKKVKLVTLLIKCTFQS